MTDHRRYAVYWAPAPGPLADFTAAWLGWDAAQARAVAHPALPGLPAPVADLTAEPRRYGFHGTLKAPFRLAPGRDAAELRAALRALAAARPPTQVAAMEPARLSGFVALRPVGDTSGVDALAAALVEEMDPFRAALTAEEIARRHPEGLDPRRRDNLLRWGYPHVMADFRFHLTLSGPLEAGAADALIAGLGPLLAPLLPRPFPLDRICLCGERPDGRFEILEAMPLCG